MHSVTSRCMSACVTVWCWNCWKLWLRTFIFGVYVHLENLQVRFIYQGHRVKVKVTGAKSVDWKAIRCAHFVSTSQVTSHFPWVFPDRFQISWFFEVLELSGRSVLSTWCYSAANLLWLERLFDGLLQLSMLVTLRMYKLCNTATEFCASQKCRSKPLSQTTSLFITVGYKTEKSFRIKFMSESHCLTVLVFITDVEW